MPAHTSIRLPLLLLCLLLLASPALAAPGDAVLYPGRDYNASYDEDGEEIPFEYADSVAVMPDGVYTLVNSLTVTRWRPGDEAPATLYTMPEGPGYYMAYDYATEAELADAFPAEELASLTGAVHRLIPGDDGLYGLNLYTLRLARVGEAGHEFLDQELSMPPMRMEDADWQPLREILNAFVFEGNLYLQLGSTAGNDWESSFLYRVGLDGSPYFEYEALEDFPALSPFRPGQLLVASPQQSKDFRYSVDLLCVDAATGETLETVQKGLPVPWYDFRGFAYDPVQDAVYYLSNNQVQRLDLADGKTEGLSFLPISGLNSGGACGYLSAGYFVAQHWQGTYVRNVDPQYKVSRALRIAGGWEDDSYQAFVKAHPDIPVLLLQDIATDPASISDAIQSGETEVDLYTVYAGEGLPLLIEKGYAADLSGSETLTRDVSSMYPQVQAALTDGQGRLMAYPHSFSLSPLRVNVTLFEATFPGEELPETWADFLRLYLEFAQEPSDEVAFLDFYVDRPSLLYTVLNQFAAQYQQPDQPLDFQHPALREALALCEQLPDESIDRWDPAMSADDLATLNGYYQRANIFESNVSAFEDTALLGRQVRTTEVTADGGMMTTIHYEYDSAVEGGGKQPDEYRLATWPVFEAGGTPALHAYLTALVVNPKSSNLDLAMQYLEASVDTLETQSRYALHPDLNEPKRPGHYEGNVRSTEKYLKEMRENLEKAEEADKQALAEEIAHTEARMAEEEKSDWEISASALASFRAIAPHMRVGDAGFFSYGDDEGSKEISNLVGQYTEGALQLDAFLREITDKARMIFREAM